MNERWSPWFGQFGGFAKLVPSLFYAASCRSAVPTYAPPSYALSGVMPPKAECGRSVLYNATTERP